MVCAFLDGMRVYFVQMLRFGNRDKRGSCRGRKSAVIHVRIYTFACFMVWWLRVLDGDPEARCDGVRFGDG